MKTYLNIIKATRYKNSKSHKKMNPSLSQIKPQMPFCKKNQIQIYSIKPYRSFKSKANSVQLYKINGLH